MSRFSVLIPVTRKSLFQKGMTCMSTRPATMNNQLLRPKEGPALLWFNLKKSWMLHLMLALPMLYYFLFELLPLYGLQIVFRDYKARAGITGSEWVGLAKFVEFFEYPKWQEITINTLALSIYSLAVSFPIPIILALFLHVNNHKVLKKLTQNFSYIPHFISTVVIVGLLKQLLDPLTGIYGTITSWLNVPKQNIYTSEAAFRHLYVWSGVWQNMGWSTIMYVAALSGVSMELHEAAKIDGASRWKRILMVDLPAIAPTIAIMLIMRFGTIMSVGYEKAYLMQSDLNKGHSEIISTYLYTYGLGKNQLSYGAAVGIMNSVINSALVITVNKIADWVSDGEAGLF